MFYEAHSEILKFNFPSMIEVTIQSEKYAKKKKNYKYFPLPTDRKDIPDLLSTEWHDTVSEVYMITTITLLKKEDLNSML